MLLTVLDNQTARCAYAFENLLPEVFDVDPGGDCNSIKKIGQHLLNLRRFSLTLLQSPLATQVADPKDVNGQVELLDNINQATKLLCRAVADHDPTDWYRKPDTPREGPWGDEPTIIRFVRPLNDFANHLGSIRAIRGIKNNPIEPTQ